VKPQEDRRLQLAVRGAGEGAGRQRDLGRTLAASAWLLGDPRSQSIMDEMAKARLRSTPSGASVLADTPVR
jgi:hypothetical protein